MPRLGLHMIVKNEAHVIERCLRSVLPLIDWWVVCDTGSTDGTQDVVRRVLADVPGRLHEHEWVSFGHNRQLALDAAEALPESGADDHVLWIDADEELVDLPASPLRLTADGHRLEVEFGDLRYQRLAIVRLGRGWRWRDPIHEHLDLPGADVSSLPAPRVVARKEGARSLDPETYRKDAALLAAELQRRPDDARLQFYYAQSLRDAGELDAALAAYRLRADNHAGWGEETGVALLEVARLLERLERPADEVVHACLAAYQALPRRAEPLVNAARIERLRGRYAVAHLYAEAAVRMPSPPDGSLFVDRGTYQWRAHDEYALACYWTGRYAEGLPSALAAASANPGDERLVANVGWFHRALAGG